MWDIQTSISKHLYPLPPTFILWMSLEVTDIHQPLFCFFQVALVVKNPPANAGEDVREAGSLPESGISPGEGNGNPLQYSCLENLMDRGDWWVTVHGVAKSRTWLSDYHSLSASVLIENSSAQHQRLGFFQMFPWQAQISLCAHNSKASGTKLQVKLPSPLPPQGLAFSV